MGANTKLEECARDVDPDAFDMKISHEVGTCPDCDNRRAIAAERASSVIRRLMEPNENMADKGESALIMNDGAWIDIAADKGYPTGTWAAAVTSFRAMLQSVLDEAGKE